MVCQLCMYHYTVSITVLDIYFNSSFFCIVKLLLPAKKKVCWDFPGGTVVKNPPANAGDKGSIPGPGRSHMPRSN